MCNTELRRPGQFLGTVQEHPRRKKKREGGEQKKRENISQTFRFNSAVLSTASVFFLHLPSSLSLVPADRMKLVDIEEWVLCSIAGSVYYSPCSREN